MSASAATVRGAENAGAGAQRMADVLGRAFELWRDCKYRRRADAIAAIAHTAGYSIAMLEDSIDALLKPFTGDALRAMAGTAARPTMTKAGTLARPIVERPKTVGFIAAGNVAGAGIHEIAIALIAGAVVKIKTASAEPVFFAEFARTIAEIDRDAGARIEVLRWSRARTDLTEALIADCDLVLAYGDDATIASLHRNNVIGFGSRVSAALVTDMSRIEQFAELMARDVVLFEQLGCLSPHHIFVVSPDGQPARDLAIRMLAALETLAASMPPARIPIRDATAIRGVREHARWRAIAGEPVELFEGRDLEWTVIFERRPGSFRISPGFRTVHVTAVRDLAEFRDCIAPVSGRIEAMAVVGGDAEVEARAMHIPYVCVPGQMQSPPLDWRHGGGAFLDLMLGAR